MEEWKECKLGDFIKIKHGYAFEGKSITFDDNNIVLVTPGNFAIGGGFQEKKCKFFTSDYPEDYVLRTDDLIVTMTDLSKDGDTLGYSAKVPFSDKRIYLHNQRIGLVQFKNDSIDKEYVYWYMRTPVYQKTVLSTSSGSTVKHTSPDRICNISIPVPSLETQKKIAAILSSLDDKIELNNKINTNLEQQAQALFKNWFVNFEPFGGKMPEGWKEISLEELCTVVTKGTTPTTLGKKFTEVGINFIKGESILDNHTFDLQKISHIDDETNLMLKRSIIQPNDILFTIAGTLGRFAIIDETLTPANTNQAVGIIRANPEIISPYYLYSFFIGNWHNDYYTKRIQQAVQANLSLGTIKSLPIIIPDSQNLDKYTSLVEPLFKQMKQLENENKALSNLRDTLLPKLMNGEIELDEVSK